MRNRREDKRFRYVRAPTNIFEKRKRKRERKGEKSRGLGKTRKTT